MNGWNRSVTSQAEVGIIIALQCSAVTRANRFATFPFTSYLDLLWHERLAFNMDRPQKYNTFPQYKKRIDWLVRKVTDFFMCLFLFIKVGIPIEFWNDFKANSSSLMALNDFFLSRKLKCSYLYIAGFKTHNSGSCYHKQRIHGTVDFHSVRHMKEK